MKQIYLRISKERSIFLYPISILIGISVGLIIGLFRGILTLLHDKRIMFFSNVSLENFNIYSIFFLVLTILFSSFVLAKLVTRFPNIKGSGIMLVKARLMGEVRLNSYLELPLKFFTTTLSLSFGGSLGRKGPSIYMGALVGDIYHKLFKRSQDEYLYMLAAGSAAGLGAIFNTPIAGAILVVEVLSRTFTPALISCVLLASVSGDFITSYITKSDIPLNMKLLPIDPGSLYLELIILTVVASLLGVVFNIFIIWYRERRDRNKNHNLTLEYFFIITLAVFLGITYTWLLGTDYTTISFDDILGLSFSMILVLIATKVIMVVISSASGMPGGTFLPILIIGGSIGFLYTKLLRNFFSYPDEAILYFIVFAMLTFFTAVTRAPVTGSFLLLELTGSFEALLPFVFCAVIAYLITEILGTRSFYGYQLEKLIPCNEKFNKKGVPTNERNTN